LALFFTSSHNYLELLKLKPMLNGTMIQYFHWYTPAEGNFWKEVAERAEWLKQIGITSVWLPPATKATSGGQSVGYDVYDLYDLGEFDQKGSVRTKYGTKEEYKLAVQALKKMACRL
jgi:alpha-amylase